MKFVVIDLILLLVNLLFSLADDERWGSKPEGQNKWPSGFCILPRRIVKFEYNRHNEYTALLRRVFEYAKNPSPDLEYVIGNVTDLLNQIRKYMLCYGWDFAQSADYLLLNRRERQRYPKIMNAYVSVTDKSIEHYFCSLN